MDMISKIVEVLKSGEKNRITKFGGYIIKEVIDGGQQGIVLKIVNQIGKVFALKIFRPTDTDPKILKDGIKRFIGEVKILSSLQHKNIVKIFTGGTAIWNDSDPKWVVTEEFNENHTDTADVLYYYIMDYIDGDNISVLFPELSEKDTDASRSILNLHDRIRLFEDFISQICKAIGYYHSKGITHKDIKPDNIRYSSDDSTFIIVDFGFARHITSPQDLSTIYRTEYMDSQSLLAGDYNKNDIAQFAMILYKVLPSLKPLYDPNRFEGIKSALDKCIHHDLEKRYESIIDFYNSVSAYFMESPGWKFMLRLGEHITSKHFGRFNSKLRIPVDGSMLLSNPVKAVVDSHEFQRLRGVRQLGPTIFVFPGANHTRFEHSLGAHFLSLRYLEALMRLPAFREVAQPIDETIKLLVLSALLHDIGHYPYSHWIEEIDEFPKGIKFLHHEDRARDIICHGSFKKIIKDTWGIDPDILSNIISGKRITGRNALINSFINSIVDVDKIDYLRRDSIHCGVTYGSGIDIQRLLDSLYIDPVTERICLTDKGRSCLLAILACRNIMYQEIYWHKTVRACDAMFKRFFYEYVKEGIDDADTVNRYFECSDDHFIGTLFTKTTRYQDLNKLISPFAFGGRSLYKPAYIFYRTNTTEEPLDTGNFFKHVLSNASYKHLVDLSNRLAEALTAYVPGIKPLDIIIENTPVREDREFYTLQGFKIWNIRKKRFDDYPTEINSLNNYLANNAQAYIFCNPDYYSDLRKLVFDNKLNGILGDLLTES